MAVVHGGATLAPSKPDLVAAWLPTQPWAAGLGPVELLGSYRFDDPAGEVGIESLLFLAAADGSVLHLPLTYRGAPLEGAEPFLLGTIAHSELGTRWVYDAVGDPVAVRAFVTAILTGGVQADLDVERDGRIVERRTPAVRASGSGTDLAAPALDTVSVVETGATATLAAGGLTLSLARVLPAELAGRETLTVTWDNAEAVVAAVS